MTLVVATLFTKDEGDPATGLTLSDIDITLRSRLKADGTMANVWATQNPTEEIGGGLYSRALTGEDEATYDYFGFANYTGATMLDSDYSLFRDGPGLAAAIAADAIWDEDIVAAHNTADTAGELLDTDLADILADTNELQADDMPGLIAALNDPTAATIADAVWDEISTGHVDAGKAGQQLWTDIDAVLADTDELQGDWTDGGRLDLLLDAIKAVTDALPDAGALNDLAAILADTGTAGVVIATATAQAIADEILKRGVSNVEDAADATSLAAMVLAAFESVIAGSVWTIYKTDHATTFTTRTVTTDATARAIVEVT